MVTAENNSLTMFSVDQSHSYKCNSKTSVSLTNVDPEFQINSIELYITQVQFRAYVQHSSKDFNNGLYIYFISFKLNMALLSLNSYNIC